MTLAAFYHEQAVKVGDDVFRLVLNFGSIDAIQSLCDGRGFDLILPDLIDGTATPTVQAKVVWGLLREHHPELSIDQATTLVFGEPSILVGVALGKLINAAFPSAEPEKPKGAHPRKPRGASRGSSKPGAPKTT